MARGTPISRAGALTSSSRPPSLPTLTIVGLGTSGESFNWNGSGAGSEDTVPERERWWPESVDRYASEKEREGEWNELTVAERAADLKAWPLRFEMAGFPRPRHIR